MTSIFFTILGLSSQNSLYVFEASAMQVRGYPQKDLMDMLVRELKEDWRSWRRAISPSRQATRHGCAGGYTGAIVRAHLAQSHRMDYLFPFCDMGQRNFYHFN